MKIYAVIGSNCFTGSHIVDTLLEDPDNQVIGISRSVESKKLFLPYKERKSDNFSFHQMDLVKGFSQVVDLLDSEKPQVVINVAALSEVGFSIKQPVEYFDINTSAVVKLCDHLRTMPYLERYVHISSAEIFGNCATLVNEDRAFNPSTPYAVSKAAADLYLNTLRSRFGFPVTIIRSTNVYGKHQQLFKIIPRTMIYLMLGKTIPLYNGGRSIRPFIHIRDVSDGLVRAVDQGKSETYHLTMDSDRTISDVVRQICTLMGHDFDTVTKLGEEPFQQDQQFRLDHSKASNELGWMPKVSFEEGVAEVLDWINENWEQIKRETLVYVHKI